MDLSDKILIVMVISIVGIFVSIAFPTPPTYSVKNISISDKWHMENEDKYYIRSHDSIYSVSNTLYPQFVINNSYTVSIQRGYGNSSTMDKILTYKV